jgi:hypothetical protein
MGEDEKEPGVIQQPQGGQFPGEGTQGHAGGDIEEEGLSALRRQGQGAGLEGFILSPEAQACGGRSEDQDRNQDE